ncbi:CoA transferase [Pusillimonas sp. TS35]|uniref:CaiB/BaiF CoA transferase family protein n=1 Tax=Paracandidimonas lactea TaxID=2895524 RepID=UPI001367E32E|nr:CoA transferase [Pusillimonas sp. TS35]
MGALTHLRVLDLTRVLAGPWASQILGDLGADIIKIERPGQGDDTRAWGPPWMDVPHQESMPQSAYFAGANRNKRSMAVDLSSQEGRQIVSQLAAESDVVIENFKVGDLKKYGLDYASLCEANPRIVYCSITGFGQSGPYAERPGYDLLIQAMGGLMSITGRPDEETGGGPLKVGVAVADILTGLYATVGILAALAERDRSGIGQHIDVSLLDVQVATLANQAMNYLATGEQPRRYGNAHPNIVPYQDFPTSDGYVVVAVGNDGQFARFCDALGAPEWADDPRFRTNTARLASRQVLISLISQRMRENPSSHWLRVLTDHAVLCGQVNELREVFDHPQVIHRKMKVPIPGCTETEAAMVGSPLHMSRTGVEYRRAPPTLGAHTHEVLSTVLGLNPETIDGLRQRGVIGLHEA